MPSRDVSGQLATATVILASAVAIAAACWGLSMAAVPVCDGVAILIKAVGAAVGIGFATATTGFATAGTFAAWIPTAAASGLAAAGLGTTYIVLQKIVSEGKKKPYEWLLPALGLLAVFFVDFSKDELLHSLVLRAVYGLTTGVCTIGGGFLLLNRRVAVRAVGIVVPFLPTIVVWASLVRREQIDKGFEDFILSGTAGAIGLAGVFTMALLIVLLGLLLPPSEDAA